MTELIPFDFEEQAVRVVMRDGDPWFVAADVCRVLELGNTSQAVSRLDDDEKGITTADTLGGAQSLTIISESGLYALVLTSRKEAARRFRKWITAEVLPAIRKTGRYDHALPPQQPDSEPMLTGGGTIREAEVWLSMVREARLLAGTRAGVAMWSRSPLPPLTPIPLRTPPASEDDARACLRVLVAALPQDVTDDEADRAMGEIGVRIVPEGLFVGNATPIWHGTKWGGGNYRGVLRSFPGVVTPDHPRNVGGVPMRGIILPLSLIERAAREAAGGVDA